MWMMNDRGRDQSKPPPPPHDLVIGRKLRPLMPRPIRTGSNHPPYSTISTPPPSCCCCSRNPKTLSWTHSITAAPVVSTRWNPTPEQLQALEEMYRRGIRTPSAEQIQQIAAKLRRFGRIEGKNVFYWFQNHKARERQKKRRQIELLAANKQSGLSRRYFEIEKAPRPSNSSSTSSAESASMQMQGGAAMGAEGWAHAQHKLETAENEACWQIDLSSCLPPINSPITAHKATGQENTNPYAYQNEENQTTLQLFPTATAAATHEICTSTIPTSIRPIQFIEFLPIKN